VAARERRMRGVVRGMARRGRAKDAGATVEGLDDHIGSE